MKGHDIAPALARSVLLFMGLTAAGIFYSGVPLNHDPSFLLVATNRWLDGAVLYRDIMEINPPLIFYMTAPAVILSNALHADSTMVFVALVCVAAFGSLTWVWHLLSRVPEVPKLSRYLIVITCFAALALVPGVEFGQREHLFIVLALPYFFARILRPMGLRIPPAEAALIGLFGLPGFALKPYFVFPALFVTAINIRQERNLRSLYDPDNLVLVIGSLAYVAFVAVHHPEYFSTIIPLGMRVYDAIGFGAYAIIFRSALPLLVIIAVATLADTSDKIRGTLVALSSVLAGLLCVFVLQRKGWAYHILPFEMMALIASIFAIAISRQTLRSMPLHFALFAIVPWILLLRVERYDNAYTTAFYEALKDAEPDWHGKSLMYLSSDLFSGFPLINKLGADWAGRYPYQWVLAGAVTRIADCRTDCARFQNMLEFARRTNVDDLIAREPDVVLIDVRPVKPSFPITTLPFDYLDFLNSDPRFFAIWRHYKKIDSVFNYDIWLRQGVGH